jgi:hypothetical protein
MLAVMLVVVATIAGKEVSAVILVLSAAICQPVHYLHSLPVILRQGQHKCNNNHNHHHQAVIFDHSLWSSNINDIRHSHSNNVVIHFKQWVEQEWVLYQ